MDIEELDKNLQEACQKAKDAGYKVVPYYARNCSRNGENCMCPMGALLWAKTGTSNTDLRYPDADSVHELLGVDKYIAEIFIDCYDGIDTNFSPYTIVGNLARKSIVGNLARKYIEVYKLERNLNHGKGIIKQEVS